MLSWLLLELLFVNHCVEHLCKVKLATVFRKVTDRFQHCIASLYLVADFFHFDFLLLGAGWDFTTSRSEIAYVNLVLFLKN